MTLIMGNAVEVLTGKFKGQTGTVVDTRTDKDGTTRTQVVLSNGGVFSYLPASLRLFGTIKSAVGSSVTAAV